MTTQQHRRVERDIAWVAGRGLGAHELRTEVLERLRRAVPFDAMCASTADPDSLCMTSTVTDSVDRTLSPAFYRAEYGTPDATKHVQLAHARSPVGLLSQATGGDLARSARYRAVMAPMGVQHELRAAARVNGTTWGFVHLFRGVDRRDFDADEVDLVAKASCHLARGLRAAAVRPALEAVPHGDVPALVVFDRDGRILETTPGAEARLAALDDDQEGRHVPEALLSVAMWALVMEDGGVRQAARSRAVGRDGRWHVLDASVTDRGRIAVVVQDATPRELLPLVLASYGLSPGEREVVDLALDGCSTKAMAAELHISPHTVQDRLKGVFDKVGVRSRRDLVAKLTGGAPA
ncbi:MAG: helix-turn-helix transcriptional regulator [Solirubrobacterales bacterium]|nr:helix-turn-helix transcriptional regulator [Solirubrobacterales bacterium]